MKKLPFPTLEETQHNYLKSIKPLLNNEEYKNSFKVIENFFKNQAPILQSLLEEEKKATTTSWIYKYWLDMYLSTEGSVNVDANFCMDLKLNEEIQDKSNIDILNIFSKSLGKVCHEFIFNQFDELIDGRGNKLCSSQFEILKGASRIPMRNKDIYRISDEKVNYMTILYKNNLYKIELFDETEFFDLDNAIANILNNIKNEENLLPCISFLPTSIAGELRDELYLTNQFFDTVENSLFNISIIDKEFSSLEEKRHYMLYLEGNNSWVLKPLNFIYNLKEKDLYVNSDHTYQDAGTVIEIVKRTFEKMKQNIQTTGTSKEILIKEYISNENKEKIKLHKKSYLEITNQFYCKNLIVDFSNDECLGLSKDAIMQMILLYAHYKTYDKLNGVYEAVDMREYAYGRTECVRVLSSEAVDFVKALDSKASKKELLSLLLLANNEHKTRIKDAKKSKGIDRHLFGLKAMIQKLPEEKKKEASVFFEDISYKKVTQNFISTTCTGTLDFAGYVLFTPVVYEGAGITYLKTKKEITYLISYHKEYKNKIDNFIEYIIEGANKIKALN